MSIVQDIENRWAPFGLIRGGRWNPTFIEEVGTASAENVRSAALRRWMNNRPTPAAAWLSKATGLEFEGTSLKVAREVTLRTDSRIDLRASDGTHTRSLLSRPAAHPLPEGHHHDDPTTKRGGRA